MAKRHTHKRHPVGSWAHKVRCILEALDATHDQFAAELGISPRTLRAWLYGERQPGKFAAKHLESKYAKHLK
jgi:DNA-binding transcriptional regulator YiaG